jgi:hypothetical protein
VLEKQQRDVQFVASHTLISGADRRGEESSVFEASQKKIGTILTDQQRHKFDADEKRRSWMDGRVPSRNPGPALNGGW